MDARAAIVLALLAPAAALAPAGKTGACSASDKATLQHLDEINTKMYGWFSNTESVLPDEPPEDCTQDRMWTKHGVSGEGIKNCFVQYGMKPELAECQANEEVWKAKNCKKSCDGQMMSQACQSCQDDHVEEMMKCMGSAVSLSQTCQTCRVAPVKHYQENCALHCMNWMHRTSHAKCMECKGEVDRMYQTCL